MCAGRVFHAIDAYLAILIKYMYVCMYVFMACYYFGNKIFFKSRVRRTFLKVCLHDATARWSAPVDSTVHAPRLVQCQKIATLLGLASSRRATD